MPDEVKGTKETVGGAIEKAAGELEKNAELQKGSEEKRGAAEEKKADGKAEELSEEDLSSAKQLYAAIKDPEKGPIIVDFLAKQAGYAKIETKQEVKEARNDVVDMLKESLGQEFGFLADKLAPGISKILDTKLAENTKDIRQQLEQQNQERLKIQASQAMSSLAKDFFDKDELPKEIVDAMNELTDKISPSEGMSVSDYIKTIFYSVVGSKGLQKTNRTTQDRITKNRADAVSRLASSGTKEPLPHSEGLKKMSLKEAIDSAMSELAERGEKG